MIEATDSPAPEFLLGALAEDDAPEPLPPGVHAEAAATTGSRRAARAKSESADALTSAPSPAQTLQPSKASSTSYTVLARRYRSRDFDELIGQEPIARTLRNAIASGRTAHAYLFTGTRGVGKTSMARIFAKALNASDDLQQKDQIAQAILRGDDLDVIEIDGASNRGIDQARDLIANAGMSPARCRYKIYIIDEVHALTKDAFNALLKLMEEPPAHVKFILCTTEPHKVPATIQSRCQRFDFRAIPTARISQQIRLILDQEGVEADDEVIAQVARLGHGSMRDALSILDCVLASGARRLTAEQVGQTLGLPEHALVARIVEAIIAADPPAVLKAGAELLARGASVEQALESLVSHLRDLMISSACGAESELLELTAESRKLAGEQAAAFDTPALVYMIALCESVARHARGSSSARALFDAALVRLCLSEQLASIPALLEDGARHPKGAGTGPVAGEKKKLREPPLTAPAFAEPSAQLAELKPSVLPQPVLRAEAPSAAGMHRSRPPVGDSIDGPELWRQVVSTATSDADRAKLEHLNLDAFDGRTFRLSIAPQAASMAPWLATQGPWVASIIKSVTGRTFGVEFLALIQDAAAAHIPRERLIDEAQRLPAVQRAMTLLEASIIDVRVADPPARAGIDDPVSDAPDETATGLEGALQEASRV